MSSYMDLYPTSVRVAGSTAPITVSIDAVDLRLEFNSLIFGSAGEVPIGQPFLIRRMRHNLDGSLVKCVCLDETYGESDRDFPCTYCYGRGYLWDESLINGYKVVSASPSGLGNSATNAPKSKTGENYLPSIKFFLPYDANPHQHDRMIEIELDSTGAPLVPYVRLFVYEINLVRAMRGDGGKIEFWACDTQSLGPQTQGYVG